MLRRNDNHPVQFCLADLIRDVRFLAGHPNAENRGHGQPLLGRSKTLLGIIHRRDEYATVVGFKTALSRVRNKLTWGATMGSPRTRGALALEERFYHCTESYCPVITDPDIESTNNFAEQAIRLMASQRRITHGTRGPTGQTWWERIGTEGANCEQQGRSLFGFLVLDIATRFTHQPTTSLILDKPSNRIGGTTLGAGNATPSFHLHRTLR